MVGIKDFEMPDNCYDCCLHNYHQCDLTVESIEEDYCWNGDSREKHCPLIEVEAIPKDQYKARLKSDLVAMLEELKKSIEDNVYNVSAYSECLDCDVVDYEDVNEIIIEKINALKGQQDGNE